MGYDSFVRQHLFCPHLASLEYPAFLSSIPQVHTNIIAALHAAHADPSLLDTNGNSAQDFDSLLGQEQEVVGAGKVSGGGRLEPPTARPGGGATADRAEL